MVKGNELADSQGNQAAMQRPVFPSKLLTGMDLRRGTVIFAIYQRSFGKLIIRQPLAAAHAIAGVGQMIRLNGLQSFAFILGLVLFPQNSARALPLTWKEDTDILFIVGSVQDKEYHYLLLQIFVLHLLSGPIFTALEKDQESSFFVGDEEVLCSCSDQILEVCLLNVIYIATLNYCFSCLII